MVLQLRAQRQRTPHAHPWDQSCQDALLVAFPQGRRNRERGGKGRGERKGKKERKRAEKRVKGEKENPLRIGGLEQDQVSPSLCPGLPLTPLPALGQGVSALGQHHASCRSLVSAAGTDGLMRIGRLQSQDAQSALCPLPPNMLPRLSCAGEYSLQDPRGLSSLRLLQDHRAQLLCIQLLLLEPLTFAPWPWGQGTYHFQDKPPVLSVPNRSPNKVRNRSLKLSYLPLTN